MPNWCDNRLVVTGDPTDLKEFARRAAGQVNEEDQPLALNALVPEPAEHQEAMDWYSWRLQNWGTKWDVDVYASEVQGRHAIYQFFTAWAPPVCWLELVAPKYPQLDFALSYYEPGCYAKVIGFCGAVVRVCSEEEFTTPLEFLRMEFRRGCLRVEFGSLSDPHLPWSTLAHPDRGDRMEAAIALDHEKTPDGKAHIVRALLKITGRAPENSEHVPLNLSVVLDRSGSMSGEPLEQAKEAAALLVRRLWPEDVVSVVAYDDEVETVAEPATGEEQADLVEPIRMIETQGCTNLSGGWLRGRELVAGGKRDGAANRVLLLTDGLANVGITEPDKLVGLCRTALDQGITTTTIGFGQGYDEVLLRRMAEAGGGNTYYIEDPDQAPAIFSAEIEGLLSLSAQNLTVDLRPASAARLILIHHRYPSHATEDGVRIELGDLYARAPRMLLAEFLVPVKDPNAEVEIAELTVTAHVLTENGGVERQEIRLPIAASFSGGPKADPEVRRELLLQEAARARDEARQAQEEGDYDRASRRLNEVSAKLTAFGPADTQLQEEAEDLRQMAKRFRTRDVTEADAKYLYQRSYAAATSRAGAADVISRVGRKDKRKP